MTGKLVRDLIPDIMRADGAEPQGMRVLSSDEYWSALLAKMIEEKKELERASDAETLGELSDMLELVRAAAKHKGYGLDEVIEAANAKAAARGGFDERIWVEF